MSIANLFNQVLIYNDPTVNDNPNLRAVDWSRSIYAIDIKNPTSDAKTIPPMGLFTLFDGSRVNNLTGSSIVSINSLADSVYTLSADTSAFKTQRSVTLSTCNVTINNNSLACFDFVGGTISSVQVGDIMRVNGLEFYDTNPTFTSLNAGNWIVGSIQGTKVYCTRDPSVAFQGYDETGTIATNDVTFFAPDGIQVGDRISIEGTFSLVSQRTFTVTDITPSKVYFVSGNPIPIESNLTYIPSTINFYTNSKKLVYIEVNNMCSVRFNNDTSNNNKVVPIATGDANLVGFCQKWGDSYKCVVNNLTPYPVSIKYIFGE